MHPYATRRYAETLAHVGRPLFVPDWQTHVLVRECGLGLHDAIGAYPLAAISNGADIDGGLSFLRTAGLVTVALVIDELFGPPILEFARTLFLAKPFKTHYLVDPACGPFQPIEHHRYEIRRAERKGVIAREVVLGEVLDAWATMYDGLIERHEITGIQKFGRQSFEVLANCPGLVTIAAFHEGEMVSCHVWILNGGVMWSHLAATSARGYSLGAAYAVYDASIRMYPGYIVSLGGAAGEDNPTNGLAKFKQGFANRLAMSYLCGTILDQRAYGALSTAHGQSRGGYFPGYRS